MSPHSGDKGRDDAACRTKPRRKEERRREGEVRTRLLEPFISKKGRMEGIKLITREKKRTAFIPRTRVGKKI